MNKVLLFVALAAVAGVAHASFNFNLDNPDQTVVKPTSGSVDVLFTGSVTMSGGWAPWSAFTEFPGNGSTSLMPEAFDPAFQAYILAHVPNSNYSGNIFTVTVHSTDADGLYDLAPGNNSQFAEALVSGVKNGLTAQENEFFSVTVTSVPEPATMSLIGLGALALVKRRK